MSKRLLEALEYPEWNSINTHDENDFKKLIIWLEENRIKRASPDLIKLLKCTTSDDWRTHFLNYCACMGSPNNLVNQEEQLRWLLGRAVQIETNKNREMYMKHSLSDLKLMDTTPNVVTENPLDKLDLRGKEFQEGITKVASLLSIPHHPDPSVMLKAVSKVITERFHPATQEDINKGTPCPLSEIKCGHEFSDPVLNDAAKILRLLFIHDLRDLQTKTNELIVAVQSITANPKTDTKLGKVGI